MCLRPEIYAKVQAEIDSIDVDSIVHSGADRNLGDSLPYLVNCLHESARYYGLMTLFRVALKDLPYGGAEDAGGVDQKRYVIPKGRNVFLAPSLMHRDPKYVSCLLVFADSDYRRVLFCVWRAVCSKIPTRTIRTGGHPNFVPKYWPKSNSFNGDLVVTPVRGCSTHNPSCFVHTLSCYERSRFHWLIRPSMVNPIMRKQSVRRLQNIRFG